MTRHSAAERAVTRRPRTSSSDSLPASANGWMGSAAWGALSGEVGRLFGDGVRIDAGFTLERQDAP